MFFAVAYRYCYFAIILGRMIHNAKQHLSALVYVW
jgi:hypothetical protein